jgi:hypothetical protein
MSTEIKSRIKISRNLRGFERLVTPPYAQSENRQRDIICAMSSAIRDDLGCHFPGSSYLWVGEAHLDRVDVEQLIKHLKLWITHGTLDPSNTERAASFAKARRAMARSGKGRVAA